MILEEQTIVQGRLWVEVLAANSVYQLRDGSWTGRIIQRVYTPNKFVATGRTLLRDVIKGVVPIPSHIGVGVDNTAAADGDTALGSEVFRDFITQRLDVTSGLRFRFFLPSTAANGNTLKEAGIFNAATGGTLYARATHSDIIKTSSVAVNYTWEQVFSQT